MAEPAGELRTRLARDFQPVWREIEAAAIFGRRRLVWSADDVVPQNVMIALVMVLGSVEPPPATRPVDWTALAARRRSEPELKRRFKHGTNALSEHGTGHRPLSRTVVEHLARGLLRAAPDPQLSVDALTEELMRYARPGAGAGAGAGSTLPPRDAREAATSTGRADPVYVADVPPALAPGFQRRKLQSGVVETVRATLGLPVVLCGPAGVGKTQIAAAVLEQFSPETVIWVSNASRRPGVLEAYVRAAQALRVAVTDPGNLELTARDLIDHLVHHDGDWWLVLDDVDDPSDLRGLTPVGRRGHILWLTRRRSSGFEEQSRVVINVPGFSAMEGRRYLQARLGAAIEQGELPRSTLDGVEGLIRELDGVPLALSMAAGVLRENAYTCADYREQLSAHRRRMPSPSAPGPADDSAQDAALTMSFERAVQRDATGLASRAALLTAVLNPSGVPAKVITTAAVRRYLSTSAQRADHAGAPQLSTPATTEQLTRVWRTLESYSLVSCGSQPKTPLKIGDVRMHARNAWLIRSHLGAAAVSDAVVAAADALVELWGAVENDPRSNLDLRGHALWLYEWWFEDLVSSQRVHRAFLNLGWSFGETGRPHRAARYFDELAGRVVPRLGADHPQSEDLQYACGVWHRKEGRVDRAVRELGGLRDSMLVRRSAADQLDLAAERRLIETEVELATARGWSGRAGPARSDLSDVLDRAQHLLPPDDRTILRVRHTHAVWTARSGRPGDAVTLLAGLLPDRQRLLGDDHVSTLRTRMELAIWVGRAGDQREALVQLLGQRDDWIRVCGPDHPDTMRMLHNLALCRARRGEAADSYDLLRSVYRRRRQVLGKRHPDTLRSRQDLANLRGQRGRPGDPDAAVFQLIKLVRDETAILGPRSVETFRTWRLLAVWLARAERPATAAAELGYLESDLVRVVDSEHPELSEVAAVRAEIESVARLDPPDRL